MILQKFLGTISTIENKKKRSLSWDLFLIAPETNLNDYEIKMIIDAITNEIKKCKRH